MKNKIYLPLILSMVAITISHKQVSEIFSPENKAIRGHDPVAYFTNIELTKGLEAYKLSHGGALVFLSKENLELFKLNPRLYMPQHGGYYATRLAWGYKAPITPTASSIVDGKLYLDFNEKVKKDWAADTKEMIRKADQNWPEVKSRK